MPTKSKIFSYWKDEFKYVENDNTCFRCGLTSEYEDYNLVQRCHILSVVEGGSDNLDNLQLLCSDCHKKSEGYSGALYDLWVRTYNDKSFLEILITLYSKNILKKSDISCYELFDKYINISISKIINTKGEEYYNNLISAYHYIWIDVINNYKLKSGLDKKILLYAAR